MLINSIFTEYLQIFIKLFMICLWGWAIIFSLSHVFHHKKMIWGMLGATVLWLLSISEFIVSFPKTILILLPNVAFTSQIIEKIEQYWQYLQSYYLQESIITFSVLLILIAIVKDDEKQDGTESEEVEKTEKIVKVEKREAIDYKPQPIEKNEKTFIDANEKTFVSPTVPDFDTERDIKLRSTGQEKQQKVLREYNTITTIATSPIGQDVTINASALMKEQERKEKEERFRQFSYEADATMDRKIQEAEREIQNVEPKESNLFSFSSQHLPEEESSVSSELSQKEFSALSEISAIEDTIIPNETSIKEEEIQDTIILNDTTELQQDTIIKNALSESRDEIEQDNNVKSVVEETSELGSSDYLSAAYPIVQSDNELDVADTVSSSDIRAKSSIEQPIQLSEAIKEIAKKIADSTEKNDNSESVSIETIENLAETNNTEKNNSESVSIETIENLAETEKKNNEESISIETIENLAMPKNTESNEEVELQTVVEMADFDYNHPNISEEAPDSLMTVIETNVKNKTQEPSSLLGALATHNTDAIKLKKFSK